VTDPLYVPLACTPKHLPVEHQEHAARVATAENPVNAPAHSPLTAAEHMPIAVSIAMMTTKYWGSGGVDLSVGFLDIANVALRDRILAHMNAWGESGNIRFRQTNGTGMVRIATGKTGHWSYIGTDVKLIHPDQPTMNLQDFSMATPDSEFFRVVRHETGHTLGCPHEHMRADLVARIDPDAAFAFYADTQGWTHAQVIAQVLTPLEERSLMNSTRPDMRSIMCYQIPGDITRDGQPILGGTDIDVSDRDFIGRCYPMPAAVAAPAASAHAPATASHAHRPDDAIVVELRSGTRVIVPPHAPAEQVRRTLAALHG
jgi:hypothetical protein